MSNVRLTWALPTVSPRQRPIQATRIEFRAAGTTPWTVQDHVAVDVPQELVFFDVAPGDYEYRATVVDVDGAEGAPATASVSVPFDSPGTVSAFVATVEG